MTDALGKDPRDIWAEATAMHLVDGALSASERSGGRLPNADQVALLRSRNALYGTCPIPPTKPAGWFGSSTLKT
jgi:hypothetical protein